MKHSEIQCAPSLPQLHTHITGHILIRSEPLFDGSWSQQGPRHIDNNGYLQSGYLFIND